MGDKLRTSPTSEEEAAHQGEEQGLPEAPEATESLQEHPETPEPKELTQHIDALSTPVPSKHHCDPSQKTKKSQQRIEPQSLPTPTQISPVTGSGPNLSREIPNW